MAPNAHAQSADAMLLLLDFGARRGLDGVEKLLSGAISTKTPLGHLNVPYLRCLYIRGEESRLALVYIETTPRSFLDVTNSQFRVKQKTMLIIAVLSVISTVSASGGWSLRAPSCPTSLKSCAEGTSSCCPADLDCISVGGGVVCCPPGMQVLSPFSLILY